MNIDIKTIKQIIKTALQEDIGDGDITSVATIPPHHIFQATLIAKSDGVIAGLTVAKETFATVDNSITFTPLVTDGDQVKASQHLVTLQGPGQGLLMAERVALNFLQRMSGIATLTNQFVQAVQGTQATILDTRKTAPGLRLLDKWAVKLGGGENHRFGLFDMVLIKENHITAAGGITPAVTAVRAIDKQHRPIEVEVKNLTELKETLTLNINRILLDNMSLADMEKAVLISQGQTPLEASGNITLKTVQAVAQTGVNYISVGALTHSVKALDISLLITQKYRV